MKSSGFTLIELLIVIAIILILIAIALPNFREAIVRARVVAARGNLNALEVALNQHLLDWGSLPADYNDSTQNLLDFRSRSLQSPICSRFPVRSFATDGGLTFLGGGNLRRDFYSDGIQCPLTTPIPYLPATKVFDPFGDGTVPHSYDSRAEWGKNRVDQRIVYGIVASAGPDRVAGDWVRNSEMTIDLNGDGCREALPYNPTNGTRSRGEMWAVVGNPHYIYDPEELPCGSAKREFDPLKW